MRPYNRSLDADDYAFLTYADDIRRFQERMADAGIPHRDWHPHRIWEYASMTQQLKDLDVPVDATIVDIGAGGSFFDPYLALKYPNLICTDSMKYGDVTPWMKSQRNAFGVSLLLYDLPLEDMAPFADGTFDVSLCVSTIEHVDDHETAFHELVRITKPGGYIFITSDYFRDLAHYDQSVSKHLQVTPYTAAFVTDLPNRFAVDFVGETDFGYRGDFVHNYSFVNLCLRKRAA